MPDRPAQYSVDISMDEDAVRELTSGNFALYGFKAVQTSAGGVPLVWFQTRRFGRVTQLAWTARYEAYTSLSQIVVNGVIVPASSYDIDLDETLHVTSSQGSGNVDTRHGAAQAISISNETSTQVTCGISQSNPEGGMTPMCTFSLYGGIGDVIAPVEQILLMFSSMPVSTGTVVTHAPSRGVMIDLTGESARSVSYDVDAGWSWGGGPWARQVGVQEDVVPLLIQRPPSLAKRRVASLQPY